MTTVGSSHPSLWRRIPARGPWLIVSLLLLAALIGIALYYLFGRERPVVENVIPQVAKELPADVRAKAAALAEENRKLEEELDRQRSQPIDCPPGQSPKRVEAPTKGAMGAAMPGNASAASGKAELLSNKALTDRLEKSTVLILTDKGTGTGFFIGPQTIVTNRHVVQDAQDGMIFVTSRSLRMVRQARLVRMTPSAEPRSPDFAVLQVDTAIAPAILPLTPGAAKLSSVYAAGYPGLTMMGDRGFLRLIKGDISAAPDLNLTRGEVQSLHTTIYGLPVVVHTASVLPGNSGGPLVDNCGRLVGVNTFNAIDQEQSGRVGYAQSSGALVRFLVDNQIPAQADIRPCG